MSATFIFFLGAKTTIEWSVTDGLIGLGIGFAAIIFYHFVGRLVESLLLRATSRTKTDIDDEFVKAFVFAVRLAVFLFALIAIAYFWTRFLNESQIFDALYFSVYIAAYLTVFAFLWRLFTVAYKAVRRFSEPPNSIFSPLALKSILMMLRVILVVVFVLLVLDTLKSVDLTVLWIVLAVLGLVLLAFSSIMFYDASKTLFLRSSLPVKIGDIVNIDGNIGCVVEFRFKFVKLLTPEKTALYVPYKKIYEVPVENISERQTRRFRETMLIDKNVGAQYVERFLTRVNELLNSRDEIEKPETDEEEKAEFFKRGQPFAYLTNLNEQGYEILIQFRICEPSFHKSAKIAETIMLEIMKLAEAEGVKPKQRKKPGRAPKAQNDSADKKQTKKIPGQKPRFRLKKTWKNSEKKKPNI